MTFQNFQLHIRRHNSDLVDKTLPLVFMKEEIFISSAGKFKCTLKIPLFQKIDLLVLNFAMMYEYENYIILDYIRKVRNVLFMIGGKCWK